MSNTDNCKAIANHISRIQGQLETLKKYILEEKPCDQVVQLAVSAIKSSNSLKAKILEGYIIQELLDEHKITKEQANQLEVIKKLTKI